MTDLMRMLYEFIVLRRMGRAWDDPEYRDFYAFHLFFTDNQAREECERFLKESFEIVKGEPIPIRKIPEITDVPLIWRYYGWESGIGLQRPRQI